LAPEARNQAFRITPFGFNFASLSLAFLLVISDLLIACDLFNDTLQLSIPKASSRSVKSRHGIHKVGIPL